MVDGSKIKSVIRTKISVETVENLCQTIEKGFQTIEKKEPTNGKFVSDYRK